MAFKMGEKLYHPEFGRVKFHRYLSTPEFSYIEGGSCPKGTLTKVETSQLTTVEAGKSGSLSYAVTQGYDLFDDGAEPVQPFSPDTADPKALELFLKIFDDGGKIIISSSPSYAYSTLIAEVGALMGETDLNIAASYVNTYTEKCHAAKFDVIIPNSRILKGEGVDYKLNVKFNTNGNMCQQGIEIQIGSRPLAEFLIKRGAIPQQASPRRRSQAKA